MTAAALGTTLTLPLLEADLETAEDSEVRTDYDLEIRPGTQSGSEQVLRGFGVPGLRGGRGDLIVTVVVDTPTRLDPRQEELLRELAAIRGEESPDGPGAGRRRSRSSAGSATPSSSTEPCRLPVHLVAVARRRRRRRRPSR